MKPSILFLIDALLARGGTETHLMEMAARLDAHGYHPIVCNLGGDEPVLRALAEAGIETWPCAIRKLYLPEGRAVARAVAQKAAGRNVHVLHTFHFKSDWMGVGLARALRCPHVSSRRDLGFQQNWLRRAIYRRLNARVDAFIAPSEAVKREVMRREGTEPERIHVIYNGMDRARFARPEDRAQARAWLGVPPDGPLVGMVSGLKPIKDHPALLRALRDVRRHVPNARLALVGEGPEKDALHALAGDLGLHDAMTFCGPRQDIPRALAAMDVFVLSTLSEGMSNAILEAMARGLPVVATDVGGNPECVAHRETGFIVPVGDAPAMATCITELLADPERARAMGRAGQERVANLFDVDRMVERTAALYASLRGPAREVAYV